MKMNMKAGRVLGLFVLVVGYNSSVQAADYIAVGNMKLTPLLSVSYKHDDNIFLAEKNTKSSNITIITPELLLQSENDSTTFELGYRLIKAIYHSSTRDKYVDQNISMKVGSGLTRRLNVGLGLGYAKGHDGRGSTFTGGTAVGVAVPDKYHVSSISSNVQYGIRAQLKLGGNYSNKRYENNRFRTVVRDYDSMGGSIQFLFPIMKKTKAVLEARYQKFDYKLLTAIANLDSNEQRYLAGLDWDVTEKTSGSLRLGYMRKKLAGTAITKSSSSSSFSWELTSTWNPVVYSTFIVSTSSSLRETDGVGAYIEVTSGRLGWKHEWDGRLSHTAHVSFSQKDYVGQLPGVLRKDNYTSLGAAVNYQLLDWCNIGVSYDYANNSSNALNSDYKKNVVMVNALFSL